MRQDRGMWLNASIITCEAGFAHCWCAHNQDVASLMVILKLDCKKTGRVLDFGIEYDIIEQQLNGSDIV